MADVDEQGASRPVGYGKPPRSTRFKRGVSGNPRGRPRNRTRGIPFDHVLGQMVTIRDGGSEKRVTAAEAFLLQLAKLGLEGNHAAARTALAAIEKARITHRPETPTITRIIWKSVSPGSVGGSIDALGMAVKLRKYSDDAEYRLKPWIVEAALVRLGKLQLTLDEQKEVWTSSDKPETIRWPEWWTYRP